MWRFVLCIGVLSLQFASADILDRLVLRNPHPTFTSLSRIAFGNGVFVASDGAHTFVSPDGVDWIVSAHTTNAIADIVYAQGQFILVGGRGMLWTSADGVAWTNRATTFTNRFQTIAYGAGRFVAMSDAVLYHSTDLTNWVMSTSVPRVDARYGVLAYGNAGFVALVAGRDSFRSVDGISWTTNSLGLQGIGWFTPSDLDYGNGLYLVCGYSSGPHNPIYASTDGVTWRPIQYFGIPRAVASGPELHVIAGGYPPGGYFQSSPDGIAWTPFVNTSVVQRDLSSIAYGNGRFVAVGQSGYVMVGANGVDWVTTSRGVVTSLSDIAYGDAGYVVVGAAILGSTRGLDYTLRSEESSGAITYGNGSYISLGSGGFVLQSSDGVNWNRYSSASAGALWAIHFANNSFLTVGNSGTIKISTNGHAWSGRFSGTDQRLRGITWGSGKWVAVGAGGTILTSSDTVTWVAQDATTLAELYAITFGADKFVAVGYGATILTSTDGEVWVPQNSPIIANFLSVAYGAGLFVAAGDWGEEFIYSTNGVHWSRRSINPPAVSAIYPKVAFVNDGFVFLGSAGGILQTGPENVILAGRRVEEGAMQIVVHGGAPGMVCCLQKMSELIDGQWVTTQTFTNALPFVKLRDDSIGAAGFYRVVTAP